MHNPIDTTIVFHIGSIPVTMILVVTWGLMAATFLFAAWLRMNLKRDNPGKAQQVVEIVLDWLSDEIRNIVNRDPAPFIPVVVSLFLFILICNMASFVFSFLGITTPTANIATTGALATVVFFSVPLYGIGMTGTVNYLKNYVSPTWIMLPFNLIGELSRTLALAIRLFGNMVSGEILFGVLVSLVPFFLPLPIMFLSAITGVIQAYIFAVLTIVYIGGAVKVVEKHEQEELPT